MSTSPMPLRLHHNAYVTQDQEATRRFYEDLIGMPLIATWAEKAELWGKERTYCHTFFGMADGGALAFFQFADPADQAEFGPTIPRTPFNHIALKVDAGTQDQICSRLVAAGYKEPEYFYLDHGYCRSLYVTDPNGLIVEFTVDPTHVADINAVRRADAHAALASWLAGNHTPNNLQHRTAGEG
jgi:glyoxylase I family protein